jgi:hypothetical protein
VEKITLRNSIHQFTTPLECGGQTRTKEPKREIERGCGELVNFRKKLLFYNKLSRYFGSRLILWEFSCGELWRLFWTSMFVNSPYVGEPREN